MERQVLISGQLLGAFATVYKALNSETGDFVALKRIRKLALSSCLWITICNQHIFLGVDKIKHKQLMKLLAEGMMRGNRQLGAKFCLTYFVTRAFDGAAAA